jgi:hypothetical protein
MGKLLGWSRRKRAEQTLRYQEFAAATSQALLPAPASQPEQPPAKPEPPAQPRSWLRSRVHGQRHDRAPDHEQEPSTPVPVPALFSGGCTPIPQAPYLVQPPAAHPAAPAGSFASLRDPTRLAGSLEAALVPRSASRTPRQSVLPGGCTPIPQAPTWRSLRPWRHSAARSSTFTIGLQDIYLLSTK